jgi:hypothetical protein
VQVEHGGLHTAVAQQALQGRQVGAGLQQVRGIAVPQRMDVCWLGQSRQGQGLTEGALQRPRVQGLALAMDKEVVLGTVQPPVSTQFLEQQRRQGQAAVLGALAAADPQHVASAVHVGDAQVQQFAQAQAAAVGQAQQEAVAWTGHGGQQAAHFVGAENDGQLARLFGKGDPAHPIGLVQDMGVEEA